MTGKRGALLIVSLSIVFGLVLWLRRERSLLDRATRIANVREWICLQHDPYRLYTTYQWISGSELLLARRTDPKQITFYRRSLATGEETPLETLSRQFNAVKTVPTAEAAKQRRDYAAQLSPDGRWLMWEASTPNYTQVFCAALDGSQLVTTHLNYGAMWDHVRWLSDSRRWLAETSDAANSPSPTITVYGLDQTAAVKHLRIAPLAPDQYGNYLLLAAGLRKQINLQPEATGLSPQEQVAQAGLQGHVVPLERDPGAVWHDIVLFEQAALYQDKRVALLQFRGDRQYLRLSSPDGSHAYDLGSIPFDSKQYWKQMHELRWLPDGNRLSFLYDNALYTVPAD